jgi:hypothetical protein
VIAQHSEAIKAANRAAAARNRADPNRRRWRRPQEPTKTQASALKKAERVLAQARLREEGAAYAVFTTAPTTFAGISAVLDHVGRCAMLKYDGTTILADVMTDANGHTDAFYREQLRFPTMLAEAIHGLQRGDPTQERRRKAKPLSASKAP